MKTLFWGASFMASLILLGFGLFQVYVALDGDTRPLPRGLTIMQYVEMRNENP